MVKKAENWLNFSEASRSLHKNKHYISTHFRRNPQYFEDIEIIESGRNKMLRESDLPLILARLKKGDARKSNSVFFRVKCQNEALARAPIFNSTGTSKRFKGGN